MFISKLYFVVFDQEIYFIFSLTVTTIGQIFSQKSGGFVVADVFLNTKYLLQLFNIDLKYFSYFIIMFNSKLYFVAFDQENYFSFSLTETTFGQFFGQKMVACTIKLITAVIYGFFVIS
jgi:hypothetical protein